jgi:hypothetical protein
MPIEIKGEQKRKKYIKPKKQKKEWEGIFKTCSYCSPLSNFTFTHNVQEVKPKEL